MTIDLLMDPAEPEEYYTHYYGMIDTFKRQYEEGTTAYADYLGMACFFHGIMKHADETRKFADMVKACDANPETLASTDLSLARILIHEGKMDEAVELYKQALATFPEHDVALEELGYCLLHLKRYDESIEYLTQTLKVLEYDQATVCEALGKAFAYKEDLVTARSWFERALAESQDDSTPYYRALYSYDIGVTYEQQEDHYMAMHWYKQALDLRPDFGEALNSMAAMYYNHEEDIPVALEYLKKAEGIAEENENGHLLQTVYINLARLYGRITNFEMQEHYQMMNLALLGFPVDFDGEGDDDEEWNEDEDGDGDDSPAV